LGTPTDGATIRFTTDGSDPDASSPIFGAPIRLTETTTLKAQATKDGLTASDVASALFIVNQQTRVSINSDGTEANGASVDAIISADGRYVAFRSLASNLVASDNNDKDDIFVHDRQTGQTTRVSVSSALGDSSGASFNPGPPEGNANSSTPSISADGRHVAFRSVATDLVAGDTNGLEDIFVHDRQTGQTTRVNVSSSAEAANADSGFSSISADGRHVAFYSFATNLVAGDGNGKADVFVHDRQTGQTTRVSVSSDGTEANGASFFDAIISADGRYVAFTSEATNLVPGDENTDLDVFVHDRQTGQTTRVSITSDAAEANGKSSAPSISADGRFVAFESPATNLVDDDTNGKIDIFVRDRGE
jgi:Tol biopolymer transport system component